MSATRTADLRPGSHPVRRTVDYVAGGLLTALVLLLAAVGLSSSVPVAPVHTVVGLNPRDSVPAVGDSAFAETMSLLTGTALTPGNDVTLMTDGNETYPRLWADMQMARRSLTVQMYYAGPGAVSTRTKNILIDRAHVGVRVLYLADAFGTSALSNAYLDSLRAGGVQVAEFRPLQWYALYKAERRSHVRVVVVDGALAYTGGFGFDDKWLGDGRHRRQWRDSNVRFTGPAVHQLQAAFAVAWAEATGELIAGDLFFPEQQPAATRRGGEVAGLLFSVPTGGSTSAERLLALSIAAARTHVYISNSYFIPDHAFCNLLEHAASRGVDVRILTAGPSTDVATTRYASRHRYDPLLRAGVRIYEYLPAMMHAKTIVVDGRWSSVGTENFDNRSMELNDESDLLVLDPAFGGRMDSVFHADLRLAHEVTLDQFEHRPRFDRVKETVASVLSGVL